MASTDQRCGNRCSGSAIVEFIVIAPVLLLVFVVVFDFGRAIAWALRVEYAAYAGVMYAYQRYSGGDVNDPAFALMTDQNDDVIGGLNAAAKSSIQARTAASADLVFGDDLDQDGNATDGVTASAYCECRRLDTTKVPAELVFEKADSCVDDDIPDFDCQNMNSDGEPWEAGPPAVMVQVQVTDNFVPVTPLLERIIGDTLLLTVTKTQQLAQ
ncbi:TadE/TadG family type IV pilus assembly protein [Thiohalocapsa marina]|uniref:TadE/TadG family type IV pilus assembly protein n=1 Tax=Thiohalocapsa marina TaxID=424902 RepID=UPI0014785E65|nr:TadE/TadG family type IV pilus assembly protein [Thiohalocapsa marina]